MTQEPRSTQKKPPSAKKWENAMLSASTKLWVLLRLNVLFIVFGAALVTLPKATAAMCKVHLKLLRKGDCDVWRDFWREFRRGFLKSLAAGAVMAGLMAAVALAGWVAYGAAQGFAGALVIALAAVCELYLLMACCYLFPMMALVDLSAMQSVKNALLLPLIELKCSLLLILPLAMVAACILWFPYSLPFMVLGIFSMSAMLVCHSVNKPLQKRIIEPYYAKEEAESTTENEGSSCGI